MSTQEQLARTLGIHQGHSRDSLAKEIRVKRKSGGNVPMRECHEYGGPAGRRIGYKMNDKREPHLFGGLARGFANVAKTGLNMARKAFSNADTRNNFMTAGKHLYKAAQEGGIKGVGRAAMNAVRDEGTRNKMMNTARNMHRDANAPDMIAAAKGGRIKRSRHAPGGVAKMRRGQYQ